MDLSWPLLSRDKIVSRWRLFLKYIKLLHLVFNFGLENKYFGSFSRINRYQFPIWENVLDERSTIR